MSSQGSPQECDETATEQRKWGWIPRLLIALSVILFLTSGAVGGWVSYLVATSFGKGSTPAIVTGAVVAFFIVCANTPSGLAVTFLNEQRTGNDVADSVGALFVALVMPFFVSPVIIFFGALVAIPGAMVFAWFEPLTAALVMAIVFPFIGLVSGMLAGASGHG